VNLEVIYPMMMGVRTDYEILAPVILYESVAIPAGQLHTRPVTVTMLGGVVMINGLTFTSTHDALPRLESGTEALFLLRQINSRFFIGGTYYGVFGMLGGKLMPLSTKQGLPRNCTTFRWRRPPTKSCARSQHSATADRLRWIA
jgi:hypothetical protein